MKINMCGHINLMHNLLNIYQQKIALIKSCREKFNANIVPNVVYFSFKCYGF